VSGENLCLVWRTLDSCNENEQCRPIDGEAQCVVSCAGVCAEGEEACSEDTFARLICVIDATGCTSWEESACPTENHCVENESGGTECSCALCNVGEEQCSQDLSSIMTCQSYGTVCSRWELSDTCNLEEYEFCSVQGIAAQCAKMGDSCDSVYPVNSIPYQIQLMDFEVNFANSISLSDPTCGGPLANSNDIAFSVDLVSGETIRVLRLSGPDVSIKILRTCSDDSPCQAFADNDLIFTAFESGNYIIVVERDGPGTGNLNLGITYTTSLCTSGEEEPNDSMVESNEYPGPHSVWCSTISSGTDTDCVQVEIGATGYILEAYTTDIYWEDQCPGDTYLMLYDSVGNVVAQNDNGGVGGDCAQLMPTIKPVLMDLAPGTYHLCVNHASQTESIDGVATHINVITTPSTFVDVDFDLACPPPGWQGMPLPTDANWTCVSPGTGRRMAASIDETGYVDLLTQTFDVTGMSTLILTMDHQLDGFNAVSQISGNILIKPQGESPIPVWSAMVDVNPLTPGIWDLSSFITGLSQVQIIFRLEASISVPASGNWEIDNVRVVGY
ncbi:hypothetical protein KJ865_09105, partial [Myxococcota bacterium]|nr:hypothetical protein [Myxococcota bacterium]